MVGQEREERQARRIIPEVLVYNLGCFCDPIPKVIHERFLLYRQVMEDHEAIAIFVNAAFVQFADPAIKV